MEMQVDLLLLVFYIVQYFNTQKHKLQNAFMKKNSVYL